MVFESRAVQTLRVLGKLEVSMSTHAEYATGYQILARSHYKSSLHELAMMQLVRDPRSKAKHKRAAKRYQNKSADAYSKAQQATRDALRYEVRR